MSNVTQAPFLPEPFSDVSEPGESVPSFHVPWAVNGRWNFAVK